MGEVDLDDKDGHYRRIGYQVINRLVADRDTDETLEALERGRAKVRQEALERSTNYTFLFSSTT